MTTNHTFPGGLRRVNDVLCIYVGGAIWDASTIPDVQPGDYVTVAGQDITGDCLGVIHEGRTGLVLRLSAPVFYVPADRFPVHVPVPVYRKVTTYLTITVGSYEYSVGHLHDVVPGSLVRVLPDPQQPAQKTAPVESHGAAQQSTSALPRRLRSRARTGPKPSRPAHSGSVRSRRSSRFSWVRD